MQRSKIGEQTANQNLLDGVLTIVFKSSLDCKVLDVGKVSYQRICDSKVTWKAHCEILYAGEFHRFG